MTADQLREEAAKIGMKVVDDFRDDWFENVGFIILGFGGGIVFSWLWKFV